MEWPGSKPNKSHLPRITHEGVMCCSAKPRAAIMSTGRTACFYTWPFDRWQHCSPSSSFFVVWEEVSTRGAQWWRRLLWYWVAGMQRKTESKKVETGQCIIFELFYLADCNLQESSLGDPPLVNTSALCHDRFFFWCSYHAGLLDMSQWSRRRC